MQLSAVIILSNWVTEGQYLTSKVPSSVSYQPRVWPGHVNEGVKHTAPQQHTAHCITSAHCKAKVVLYLSTLSLQSTPKTTVYISSKCSGYGAVKDSHPTSSCLDIPSCSFGLFFRIPPQSTSEEKHDTPRNICPPAHLPSAARSTGREHFFLMCYLNLDFSYQNARFYLLGHRLQILFLLTKCVLIISHLRLTDLLTLVNLLYVHGRLYVIYFRSPEMWNMYAS